MLYYLVFVGDLLTVNDLSEEATTTVRLRGKRVDKSEL